MGSGSSSCLAAQMKNVLPLNREYDSDKLKDLLENELGKYLSSSTSSSASSSPHKSLLTMSLEPPVSTENFSSLSCTEYDFRETVEKHRQQQQLCYPEGPLSMMSTSRMERMYDQETWRMHNRIQKARCSQRQNSTYHPETLQHAIQYSMDANHNNVDHDYFLFDNDEQKEESFRRQEEQICWEDFSNSIGCEEEIFELDM